MMPTLSSAIRASSRALLCLNPTMVLIKKSATRMANTDPNPTYNFLPIVIANYLRSPLQGGPHSGRSRQNVLRPIRLAVPREIEFDHLCALLRRGHKSPLLHGVETSLDQQRMPTNRPSAFHATLGSNDHFDFDLAGHVHALGQFGINRGDPGLDLALTFLTNRLTERRPTEKAHQRRCRQDYFSPPGSHRHHSSSELQENP